MELMKGEHRNPNAGKARALKQRINDAKTVRELADVVAELADML